MFVFSALAYGELERLDLQSAKIYLEERLQPKTEEGKVILRHTSVEKPTLLLFSSQPVVEEKPFFLGVELEVQEWNYGAFCVVEIELYGEDQNNPIWKTRTDVYGSVLLPHTFPESEMRYVDIPARKGAKSARIKLIVEGNPVEVEVKRVLFGEKEKEGRGIRPFDRDEQISMEEYQKAMETMEEKSARIIQVGDITGVEVSGERRVPVIYKTHPEPAASQHQLMEGAGVPFHLVSVILGPHQRIGAEIYPAVWEGDKKYNFAKMDERIEQALRAAPDAEILVGFTTVPYNSWGDENPDEIIQNEKGERGIGKGVHNTHYGNKREDPEREFWCPSISSEKYFEDLKHILEAALAHMKTKPYYKAVVGFALYGGDDGQWGNWARSGFENHGDFSPAGVKGFQNWLRQKYGTEEALQKSWKQETVSFESVSVPAIADRRKHGAFFDPATEMRVIDYLSFETESRAIFVDRIAGVLKEGAEKEMIIGCYFQDAMYGRTFSYQELPRIRSKNLDFLASPYDYGPWRKPGYAGGEFSAATDSLRLHRKLYVLELDYRTAGSRYTSHWFDRNLVGRMDTDEEFDSVNLRATGLMMNYGMGQWYYHLAAGSFAVDFAQEGIAQSVDLFKDMMKREVETFHPKVAVFFDGIANQYVSRIVQRDLMFASLGMTRSALLLSGVSCAFYGIEDLQDARLPEYDVYVFLNSYYLDKGQREFIEKKLKQNGKTLVWMHAAGYLDESGMGVERFKALTGIEVEVDEKLVLQEVRAEKDLSAPFESLLLRQGVAWGAPRAMTFKVIDPDVTVLGRYKNGDVANVWKKFPDHQVLYLGTPGGLGPDMLNAAVKAAGITPVSDAGNVVVLRNGVLTVHGVQGGEIPVRLPKVCRVVDMVSGKVEQEAAKEFVLNLNAGETRLFLITN